MLQADQHQAPEIKLYDYMIISPFAWVISQSLITGNILFMILAYSLFMTYAHKRREEYGG